MKKTISMMLIACLACLAFTFTSCEDEKDTTAVCYGDWAYQQNWKATPTAENDAALEALVNQLNARSEKVVGKRYNLKCDDDGKLLKGATDGLNKKLSNDKQVVDILKKMAEVKDPEGNFVVDYAGYRVWCGDVQVGVIIFD